ncbi:UNVERIFIED_CONTAM: hypothetical protein FKN15_075408 [Acipenser sinensis]
MIRTFQQRTPGDPASSTLLGEPASRDRGRERGRSHERKHHSSSSEKQRYYSCDRYGSRDHSQSKSSNPSCSTSPCEGQDRQKCPGDPASSTLLGEPASRDRGRERGRSHERKHHSSSEKQRYYSCDRYGSRDHSQSKSSNPSRSTSPCEGQDRQGSCAVKEKPGYEGMNMTNTKTLCRHDRLTTAIGASRVCVVMEVKSKLAD